MLKIYTAVALLVTVGMGIADVFVAASDAEVDCARRSVICADGATYYWASALGFGLTSFVVLLWVGYPIIIAGRIGKTRNRRGYLAGIFFGWLGLIYIMVRKPRTGGPDLLSRAVADYRSSAVPGGVSDEPVKPSGPTTAFDADRDEGSPELQ